jgi:hypothetical protein
VPNAPGGSRPASRPEEDDVTFRRILAIGFIFGGASVAWTILGSSVLARTGQFDGRLEQEVRLLWGGAHRQAAPDAWVEYPDTVTETESSKASDGRVVERQVTKHIVRRVPAALESTRATADLQLEHRQKGLLWYATYGVSFAGAYTFRNPDTVPRAMRLRFPLPAENALFDDFTFTVNGQLATLANDVAKEMVATVALEPGAVAALEVRYKSRGLGTWTYAFAQGTGDSNSGGTARVRDFQLSVTTNVPNVDFPAGAVSPSQKSATAQGWRLDWRFTNLLSGQTIGLALPEKLNPGPFAARVTFFAPVGLLFFLAVMVILGATRGPNLHPMHYWFIACAFFAFHLLLAYLVDHVAVHVAFAASAAVSLLLVISYLRLVTGMQHALFQAGATQLVFLVLFSYAFFFEGFTGLAITVGAIATLFVLMQVTARVSWDDVFAGSGLRGPRAQEAGHGR